MWNGIKAIRARSLPAVSARLCLKTAAALFALLLCLGGAASAAQIGDVIGEAVGTDIVSYINNYPLPSYSINGRTAVLASDLDGYGFTYAYNDYLRRVDLRFVGGEISPLRFWTDKSTYGKPVAKVLFTDIEVYLDGERLESFNVDGLTAIYFSSLAACGEVSYDDGERAACLSVPSMDFTERRRPEDRSTAVAPLRYSWHNVNGPLWDCTLMMPVSLYNSYSAIDREEVGLNNYAAYAGDSGDDIYISALARSFAETAERYGLSGRELLDMVIDAVQQSFTYVDDSVAKGVDDYPNFPIETLFEQKGDCEDTAMLLAAILKELGFDAVLLTFVEPNGGGHMAVGVSGEGDFYGTCYPYNDKLYFYVETTGPGWDIGVVPLEQQGLSAHIIEF